MDFLKKHYEKIVLGIVLVGLAVAAGALPFFISSEKQKLNDLTTEVTNPRPKPLTNLDLTLADQTLKRASAPFLVDLGAPNRLFNPMPWQKTDHLIPMDKVGPTRLAVTNISPLVLTITLDSVNESVSGPRYVIGIQNEAAVTPDRRSKKQYYCTLNLSEKSDPFTVVEIKGKPEDPTQVVLELKENGQRAVLKKDANGKFAPFERVDGYMADMYYDLEKKPFLKERVGGRPLTFNGEEYKIVAISTNEVVLSAKSNGKKWTVKATAPATPATH